MGLRGLGKKSYCRVKDKGDWRAQAAEFASIHRVGSGNCDDITAVSKKENVRWVMKAGRVVVDKTKTPDKN
jgi:hypothetical protein